MMWRQTQPATLTLRRVLGRPLAGASKSTSKDWLVVDMILEGKPSPMQCEVKAFLAEGDTPERRKQFIYRAFDKFIEVSMAAFCEYQGRLIPL